MTDTEKSVAKDRNHNRNVDDGFDALSLKYNLTKLDAAIANQMNWDDYDKESDIETMQQRYNRKKQHVIEILYSPFDFNARQATKTLTDIGKDITCTFKSLLFINCVFLATKKNWTAFFLNPGCLWFSKTIFNEIDIENFYFQNEKGLLNIIFFILKNYIL